MDQKVRRSGRTKRPNPKYQGHRWTDDTLRLTSQLSENSSTTSQDVESDVDFETTTTADLNKSLTPGNESGGDEFPAGSVEEESSVVVTGDDEDDENEEEQEDDEDSEDKGVRATKKTRSALLEHTIANDRGRGGKFWAQDRGLRTRGQHGLTDKVNLSKDRMFPQIFGPGIEDLEPVLQARDLWYVNGRDITFPSRTSLSNSLRLFTQSQQTLDKDHLTHHGADSQKEAFMVFAHQQETQIITQPRVHEEAFLPGMSEHEVILGPSNQQRARNLPSQQALRVGQFWLKSNQNGSSHMDIIDKPMETDEHSHQKSTPEEYQVTEADCYHSGHLLNVGAKVSSLAWAPYQHEEQYLALSTSCSSTQRSMAPAMVENRSPAFSPRPPFPSSIQIWRITPVSNSDRCESRLDYSRLPQLDQVLCTTFGNIRHLQWADATQYTAFDSKSTGTLGMLGVLYSDGSLRLISVPRNRTQEVTYSIVSKPAITINPPKHTVFTAFCFASHSDLVVGAADGTVRLYNFLQPHAPNESLEPYLTRQLCSTYIMSLAVVTESPHYLACTSAAGDLVLVDLRSPEQDLVMVHKARLPTATLSYLPFTRSFITTSDSSGNSDLDGATTSLLVCHHLRHFYHGAVLARLPGSSGIATAIATSLFHPCILVATAKGTVFATNYLRKVLPTSRSGLYHKPDAYWQKLYEYSWRPKSSTVSTPAAVDAENSPTNLFHGRDNRPGASRFHEGFKATKINLGIAGKKRKKGDIGGADQSSQVIYEEEQAVVKMAWNSNPKYSTWAAVAWGSGILRIQDLSHDAQ